MSDLLNADLTAGAAATEQPTAPSTAPAASTPVAPAAAPAITMTRDELQALVDQAVARAQGGSARAPEAPANPPSKTNLFAKGSLVSHTYFDTYTGHRRTRYGVVVDVLAADSANEDSFARSVVAWFESVSGPIGDHELEAG